MTRAEVRKLLGGHAPGTLTEAERKALYAAALEDQALFDTLMDEEALRELLADPEAKARLLAALAEAPPKVLPLWRRPGVMGAAASLILAATAGLAYLRSPGGTAPLEPAPRPGPSSTPLAPPLILKPAAPAPAPRAVSRPARVEAPPAPAEAEVDRSRRAQEVRRREPLQTFEIESLRSLSKVKAAAPQEVSVPPPSELPKGLGALAGGLPASPRSEPTWVLESLPDGSALVVVEAPLEAQVLLLRRGEVGVEVVRPEAKGTRRFRLRLSPGDALDLFVLDQPVSDPAGLPEAGPVAGFRVRIHPAAK